MTQRDLDEAVARLRAASLRNDPAAADLAPDLGPPRGRPEAAGQGPLDPDIVDAHAHVVDGHGPAPVSSMPIGGAVPPPAAFVQPLPQPPAGAPAEATPARAPQEGVGQAASAQARQRPAARENAAPAPVLDPEDRRAPRGQPREDDAAVVGDDAPSSGLAARLPSFLRARSGAAAQTLVEPRRRPPRAHGEAAAHGGSETVRPDAPPRPRARQRTTVRPAPRTAKEQRWERRRRRHLLEEILGWVLVPVILVALYWAVVWGLSLFGLSLDDVVEGLREAWGALQ
ncbi:hypothetical protein [Salinarimonas rosea]|uniref:hypothetical protein n=1 Tax=Salinarimonas rosea TaxID=552063 RepID=UPI0004244A1D|nr:hypothetical protein [Salinarimonas rosea]